MRILAAEGVYALAVLTLRRVDLQALLLTQGAADESADAVVLSRCRRSRAMCFERRAILE
jgi:hypothetical protein